MFILNWHVIAFVCLFNECLLNISYVHYALLAIMI